MASVGKLVATLTANTTPFSKGMKRGQRSTKGFAASMARTTKLVVAFGAALASVAIVGISRVVRGQLELLDATGKLSDRLGIATEDLQKLIEELNKG